MTVATKVHQLPFTLTDDQQAAMEAFHRFLSDPVETVFVLQGYSGCGKSTLVRQLVEDLPKFMKAVKLINPSQKEYELALTATTNKAAENLGHITGYPVSTIHSFLGLRVQTDYKTNTSKLIPKNSAVLEDTVLFIDEASYIDRQLLELIFKKTHKCKIVFIGDPAQLTPVKSVGTPVFAANFSGAALTQVVRQAEGNPIVDLSTKFRNTVNSGEFFQFKPDGQHVIYMQRDEFNKAIEVEFTRPDWRYSDSKILGWTNKCVIGYNNFIRSHAQGNPDFQVGDYAICNSFLSSGKDSFKTDQLVEISLIGPEFTNHEVLGRNFTMDNRITAFMPNTLADKNAAIKKAKSNSELNLVQQMEEQWVDLRAAYASTINKSQGSTYGKVFIDLDDVSKCTSGESIARMLYVAVSRAKDTVVLTGDLI